MTAETPSAERKRGAPCPLDKATRDAVLAAPETLTRGDKHKTPSEMWRAYKTYEGIANGAYTPPEELAGLSLGSAEARGKDVSLDDLEGLIAHPAVFHTPLHEKADHGFCLLHPNMMVLHVDARVRDQTPVPAVVFGTGMATGSPARFPDYTAVRHRPMHGLPLIESRWTQDGLEFVQESFVVGADAEAPGSYDYKRVLWERLRVANPCPRTVTAKVFKCFARHQRAKFGGCNYNRLNGYPMDGWQEGLLEVRLNGVDVRADAGFLCRIDLPEGGTLRLEPFPGGRHPDSFRTRLRVPCVRLRLAAGEEAVVAFRTAMCDRPWTPAEAAMVKALDIDTQRARCVRRWKAILRKSARLDVPDKRWQDAWNAQAVCLHQSHHRFVETDEVYYPNQGPVWPMSFWAGEAQHCVETLDRLGRHKDAARVLEYFLRKQIDWSGPVKGDVDHWSGAFDSSVHWMQDTGVILKAMGLHYRLSRDEPWLKRKAAAGIMGMEWIHRQRQRTKVMDKEGRRVSHYGLLPAARANDGDDRGYFYSWTDAPTWLGLAQMTRALDDAGIPIPKHLAGDVKDYARCFRRVVRIVKDLFPGSDFIPQLVHPPKAKNKQPWCWPCVILPVLTSGVLPRRSPLYKQIYGKIDRHQDREGRRLLGLTCRLDDAWSNDDGGPRCGIKGTEWYILASEMDWHRLYLERGESRKALLVLNSMLAFGLTDTLQTSERINVVDPYWAPVQVNPSGSARLINMLATSIVLDHDEGLSFFGGVPTDWFEKDKRFSLKEWKTIHGAVSCEVSVSGSGAVITGRIEVKAMTAPVRADIVIRRPDLDRIAKVVINGRAHRLSADGRIVIERLPSRVDFRVEFGSPAKKGGR